MGTSSSRPSFAVPTSLSMSESMGEGVVGAVGVQINVDEAESVGRFGDLGVAGGEVDLDSPVPTTFSWNLGGQQIYVTGAWDQWQTKQPLSRFGNEFTAVLLLPVGKFQYKYIVDGEWRPHREQPTERDEHGNLNNVVEVVEQKSAFDPNEAPTAAEPLSPLETYDDSVPNTDELRMSEIPELPELYRDPILNKERGGGQLDIPSHVCVGHLNTATRHFEDENITVLGITRRWRGKYVTTVIYSPRRDPD